MKNIKISVYENKYVFFLNGYEINFCRFDNPETRASLWNIWGISKNGNIICSTGTDIVGVLREKGQADFMGGVHGDENNVNTHILADGEPVTNNCECKKVDIIMYSHLTRVSSGENVIDRTVHIELENNAITVSTSFHCLVDDFNLDTAYCGGMFAWFDDMYDYAYCNLGIIDKGDATEPKRILSNCGINHVVCKLPDSFITVENLVGHDSPLYSASVFYYGNEKRPRIKIYYACDKDSVWNKGHVCFGKARYTLI